MLLTDASNCSDSTTSSEPLLIVRPAATQRPGALAFGRYCCKVVLLTLLLIGFTAGPAAPSTEESSPRVKHLLAQMSREEKLAVIRGDREPDATFLGQAGWIRGVPRLGIPDLRFADGPPGVLVRLSSTGMPSTLSMAATFSRAEAAANGGVIGRDARALGVDVILEPYINMYRDSTFERAYNTLGEDPVLAGTLAAHFVAAAQDQGVMAMRSISCRSRRSSMSVSLPSCARTTESMAFMPAPMRKCSSERYAMSMGSRGS